LESWRATRVSGAGAARLVMARPRARREVVGFMVVWFGVQVDDVGGKQK
jgi:hypothetical protein